MSVDIDSLSNNATGMQVRLAFEELVRQDPALDIDLDSLTNAGAPFRQKATGKQLWNAMEAFNKKYPNTVDLSTIQNCMTGSQLKDAFTAMQKAISGI